MESERTGLPEPSNPKKEAKEDTESGEKRMTEMVERLEERQQKAKERTKVNDKNRQYDENSKTGSTSWF